MSTYCFDLDGVITNGQYTHPEYGKCVPDTQVIAIMHELVRMGAAIVIHTSRWLEDFWVTMDWLRKYNVPFDSLIMGKPFANVYIDDKAVRYSSYDDRAAALRIKLLGEFDAEEQTRQVEYHKSRNSSNEALQPEM